MVCLNCQKPGHLAKNCWSNKGQNRGNQGNFGSRFPQQQQQQRPQGGNPNQLRLEHPSSKPQQTGAQSSQRTSGGKLFAITDGEEAGPSTVKPEGKVLTGIIQVYGESARVLFDSGADRSFVSSCFVNRISRPIHVTPCSYRVTLPNGSTLDCTRKLSNCPLVIQGRNFLANLILFDLGEFDVVLGMDWLANNQAILECFERNVSLRDGEKGRFVFNDKVI